MKCANRQATVQAAGAGQQRRPSVAPALHYASLNLRPAHCFAAPSLCYSSLILYWQPDCLSSHHLPLPACSGGTGCARPPRGGQPAAPASLGTPHYCPCRSAQPGDQGDQGGTDAVVFQAARACSGSAGSDVHVLGDQLPINAADQAVAYLRTWSKQRSM